MVLTAYQMKTTWPGKVRWQAHFKNDRSVEVTGEGFDGDGLKTAITLHQMTEKQVMALDLGLAIFDHLATGTHKHTYANDLPNVEFEINK